MNGYRWRYDQDKQNFCFQKVAHLEFTLYSDFWLSHHGDCATFQKETPFPVKSVIMKSTAAPLQSISK